MIPGIVSAYSLDTTLNAGRLGDMTCMGEEANDSGGISPDALVISCDFQSVARGMAEAALMLAIKGFAAEAPVADVLGVSFEVWSSPANLSGSLTFRQHPGGDLIRWAYSIHSGVLVPQTEHGSVETTAEALSVLQAFISVFTTVASFSSGDLAPEDVPGTASSSESL